MPNELQHLSVREVSLVDAPANSSTDPKTGRRNPHARVALWKRDTSSDDATYEGVKFPKADFAYTPSKEPSTWKLRLTKTPGGKPDAGIVGAAVAALGKGFRGNRAQIPDSDRPAVISRVRAAWKQANPDRGGEELPDVLKGDLNEMPMTLEQLEKKFTEVEGTVTTLKSENDLLKRENELVTKMSKKQRKAYAFMSEDDKKKYMASDEEKRKAMCDDAAGKMKEKAAEDCMDAATKAEFAKAGPTVRASMIAKALADLEDGKEKEKKAKSKGGKDGSATDDDNDRDDEDDDDKDNQDEETVKMRKAHGELTDRVIKSEAMLSELQKKDRLSHFTSIAKSELPNSTGTDVEKGSELMQLAEKCGGETSELYKSMFGRLTAADKALKPMFGEVGKSGGGGAFQPEKALETIAKSIQSSQKVSYEKAFTQAMEENPALYAEYEQAHRSAVRGM
jgi:hypothetical protein